MGDMQKIQTPQAFSPNAWLGKYGKQLTEAMFPEGNVPENFAIKTLVHTSDRMVMRVAAGDKVALLKAFNPDLGHAVAGRYREIAVLLSLSHTDLIPRVFAHNRAANWLLTDYVPSKGLGDVMTAENAVRYARAMGRWYARYTDVVAKQSATEPTTWLDYIDTYKLLGKSAEYDRQRSVLAAMPIAQRVVAKNDPYLQNFLVDADDKLVGIDFEKAELKPYGWDIMVTGRTLVRHFPHMMLELTEALVDGWARGTDTLDRDAFLKLVRIFAATTAFMLKNTTKKRLRERLSAYNAQADSPADRAFETPFAHTTLVDQPADRAATLRAYLEGLPNRSDDADGAPDPAGDVVVKHTHPEALTGAPQPKEAAFCGTCKGSCCQQGGENMAFLRQSVLDRAEQTLGLGSRADVIQHYVALLPDQHIAGSCFFHGSDGCTIPREIRSETCNAYQCHALRSFNAAIAGMKDDATILLLAGDEAGVQRAGMIDGDQLHGVDAATFGTPQPKS
jgi:hypothetical protein